MDPDGFERIAGAEHVWVPAGEALDGVPFSLVVRPADREQVAACLAEAHARGTALVPMGSGSKLGWGNTPDTGSLVRLDLSRLCERIDVDPLEGVATVGAGLRVSELDRELGAHGKRTRLATPWVDATVGGTIAADPYGPEVTPERRLRDELLGLEVVLADGTTSRCGGRVVKNVTGFDLVRLHCGAMGTLGVITAASFRLRPLAAARRVVGREFERFDAALEAAREPLSDGLRPAGAAVQRRAGRVELLWLLEGATRDVERDAARCGGERLGAADWALATRELARAPTEEARVRLAGRASDALAIAAGVEAECGALALEAVLPAAGIAFARAPAARVPALLKRAAAAGWACFVEHAPAELKRQLDVFAPPADTLPLMRAVKERFDPKRVLSPGRFAGRL